MEKRTGMGNSDSRRHSLHRGVYGYGLSYMEGKSRPHSVAHSAQPYRGTGYSVSNQPGNGGRKIALPNWYYWGIISTVVIGFIILILFSMM